MALAHAQHTASASSSASPKSLAFAGTGGGAGHIYAAMVFWASGTTTMSVKNQITGADDGAVWAALGSPQRMAGGNAGYSLQAFWKNNPSSGVSTVIATESGGNTHNVGMAIFEFSGFAGTPTVTGTPAYQNDASGAPATRTTAAITSTIAAAVFVMCSVSSNSASSLQDPFVDTSTSSFGSSAQGYYLATATQTSLVSTYAASGTADDTTSVIFAIGDGSGSVDATVTLPGAAAAPAAGVAPGPLLELASPAADASAV